MIVLQIIGLIALFFVVVLIRAEIKDYMAKQVNKKGKK